MLDLTGDTDTQVESGFHLFARDAYVKFFRKPLQLLCNRPGTPHFPSERLCELAREIDILLLIQTAPNANDDRGRGYIHRVLPSGSPAYYLNRRGRRRLKFPYLSAPARLRLSRFERSRGHGRHLRASRTNNRLDTSPAVYQP